MKKRLIPAVAAGAALIAGSVALGLPTAQAQNPSQIRIVHALDLDGSGVGGSSVTVCLDDAIIEEDFTVGEQIGPVPLDPGTYDAEVFLGAVADCAGAPALQADLPVAGDSNATVMAYYDFDTRAPALTVLPDDVSCTEPGTGRLTVRHAADFGDVDVLANGAVAFPALANGAQAVADLPVGTISAQVNGAGTSTDLFGPADLPIVEAVGLEVYAILGPNTSTGLGVFTLETPLTACEVPVVTTVPAPPTQPAAPAPTPAPVQAAPTFTG
jgi:hypothetical protein